MSFTSSFKSSKDNPNLGELSLPVGMKFRVNDGQHRTAGIKRAVKEDPQLRDQTISVVLFPSENVERDQQMFSDLNRTVRKTSRSLDIMYDHRDVMNRIALDLAAEVPIFRGRVEKESSSLALKSRNFITLSALYDANV